MGLFSSNGGGATRALAARTDAGFEDAIGAVEAASLASESSAVRPLEAHAETLRKSSDFRDPLLEQALTDGLREQAARERERTNTAAGVTGASRGDSSSLTLETVGKGLLQHRSHFLQRRQADLDALTSILGATGKLKSDFSTTRIGAISGLQANRLATVAQLEQSAIELDNQPSALASILGAGISSFAGSTAGSDLIGKGITSLFK